MDPDMEGNAAAAPVGDVIELNWVGLELGGQSCLMQHNQPGTPPGTRD